MKEQDRYIKKLKEELNVAKDALNKAKDALNHQKLESKQSTKHSVLQTNETCFITSDQ